MGTLAALPSGSEYGMWVAARLFKYLCIKYLLRGTFLEVLQGESI